MRVTVEPRASELAKAQVTDTKRQHTPMTSKAKSHTIIGQSHVAPSQLSVPAERGTQFNVRYAAILILVGDDCNWPRAEIPPRRR